MNNSDNFFQELGIKYPLFQGGMAKVSNSKLVASVSNAGGLGILSSAGLSSSALREEIVKIKSMTDKPFGINLMLMQKNIPDLLKVVMEVKPSLVTTGAGTPKHFSKYLQEAGIKVVPVVASVDHAKKMEVLGVDALIAEGSEAGGHVGQTSTMVLVPHIVDAINLPVIAAGGIASGQAIVAVEALGAAGVQIGTLFLAAREAPLGPKFRQALIDSNDQATILTGTSSGAPVRNLINDKLVDIVKNEYAGKDWGELSKELTNSLTIAVEEDRPEDGSAMAGQVVGQIKEILPAKDIIKKLAHEVEETKARLFANYKISSNIK